MKVKNLVAVYKALLEHSHSFICWLCCFCARAAELSNYDIYYIVHKAHDGYYLALYRKTLLAPDLNSINGSREEWVNLRAIKR